MGHFALVRDTSSPLSLSKVVARKHVDVRETGRQMRLSPSLAELSALHARKHLPLGRSITSHLNGDDDAGNVLASFKELAQKRLLAMRPHDQLRRTNSGRESHLRLLERPHLSSGLWRISSTVSRT
jgi:hypothetical protein